MKLQSIDRTRAIRREEPIDARTEAQIARVLIAIEAAADRKAGAAKTAVPGAAAAYLRDHSRATNAEIMLATGCSRTTAREARRAIAQNSEAQA